MSRVLFTAALAAAVMASGTAFAETSGGSRQVAGGVHRSTYIDHHSHDPHSSWSQANRTGQILGAPMVHENAGAHRSPRHRTR